MNALRSLGVEPSGGGLIAHVEAAVRGDREAYARVIHDTRNVVCSISLAIVRDVAASEDVAQDVYLAAWQGLDKLRTPSSFMPWLRQLTRHRAHDHVRARSRLLTVVGSDETLAAAADPNPTALDALVGEEESSVLTEALDALPDETREVVLLYYREGKSASQVAELLGMREDAVKKRLSRAREALRMAAEERFGEVAQRTAPGARFAMSVMAKLPAPGSGAAAGVAGKLGGGKLFALLGGAVAGTTMGLLGVFAGAQLQAGQALDDEERRGIWQLSIVNALSVVVFVPISTWAAAHHLAWLSTVAYLALVAALAFTTQLWLPRVISRRLAAELAQSSSAAVKHARRKRARVYGLLIGAICGFAGLLAGLANR